MLMTTFLTAVTSENIKLIENASEEKIIYGQPRTVFSTDEAFKPNWTIGDKWTYKINDINIAIDDENISQNLSINIHGEIKNLILEVVNTDKDLYQLKVHETNLIGNFSIDGYINVSINITGNYLNFSGPIKIGGELKDTTIKGNIFINQSDLGIKAVDATISGTLKGRLEDQPFIEFPFGIIPKISLPFPFTINANINLNVSYPLIQFPFNTSTLPWGLPATNFSFGGTIESKWFEILDKINNFARENDLIGPLSKLLKIPELQNMSDLLKNILPIIDISYLFKDMLGIGDFISFPGIPLIFYCNEIENITVNGTKYLAYKICIPGLEDLASIHYAPEAGNIVKVLGNFEEILHFINNINMELMNYQPG